MKANEAPEKIYIVDITFPDYVDFDGSPINTKRIDDHDIEYTRTDAFIEKACKWIMNHFRSEGFGSPLYYKGLLYRPEDIVEDFKKDMKGE